MRAPRARVHHPPRLSVSRRFVFTAVPPAGQGIEAQVGKNVGDLYVELQVAPDPYFTREKYDVFTEVHGEW